MRLILKPDWDPRYHYHVNGKKVVITKEDWEKYKDQPYFGEIRAEVEAEQAAHPEPEYDEVENPAWRKAYQNLVNGVNLRGRDNYLLPLPQGYTRDEKGVAMDEQGNYYLPVETATNAPYFVNQERGTMGHTVPVRYELLQMPDRTIRQLRQPLPVDRVMNVENEREKAVRNYVRPLFKYKFNPPSYFSRDNKWYFAIPKGDGSYTSAVPDELKPIAYMGFTTTDFVHPEQVYEKLGLDENGYGSLSQIRSLQNRFKKLGYNAEFNSYNNGIPLFELETVLPSRQEAEKKAVIKVGDLEKVGTFAKGGKLISKYLLGGLLYNGTYGVNREYDLNNSKNLAKQMLNSMSKQDIKNLQIRLIEEKYYKIPEFINKNNNKKVKELLRQLVKLGYLKDEKEIDGIYGKRTKSAFEKYYKNQSIDGIAGNKTIDATSEYLKDRINTTHDALDNIVTRKLSNVSKQQPKLVKKLNQYVDFVNKGASYIDRTLEKISGKNAIKSSRKIEPQLIEENKEELPENFNYNSIPTSGHHSILNTNMSNISADLNTLRFGIKNYGDTKPVKARHLLLTTFNPFVSKEEMYKRNFKGGKSYIGVSPDGEIKVSTNLMEIPDNFKVTNTFSFIVKDFNRDENGELVTINSKKNPGRKLPVITIIDENGLEKQHTLNVLTGAKGTNYSSRYYDSVAGGKVIMESEGDLRLESGSAEDIANAFENFKLKHPNAPIRFYVMDNGSFSRTLEFTDNEMSEKDIKSYLNFNTGNSGTFAYVIDTVPSNKLIRR